MLVLIGAGGSGGGGGRVCGGVGAGVGLVRWQQQ